MKGYYVFVVLLIFASLNSLEFNLVEFRELPSDFHAQMESELDLDMEYCTVLRIESEIPSELNLKQKIYKKEIIQPGEYYFYITHKEKSITFEAPEYLPLMVDVPKEGLKKGIVYYVKLETIKDINVTLNIKPEADRVILDNKIIDKNNFSIAPGEYRLQIEKEGYQKIDEFIEISSKNTIFNYTLSKSHYKETSVIKTATKPDIQSETQSNFIFERYGVVFELVSCEMFDDTIIIKLLINSKNDDRSVKIIHGYSKFFSRLFDDLGNEYKPSTLKFANKSKNRSVTHNLVANITSPASLIFKNVNKNATLVPLFDLGIWMEESGNFRVSFRNIPIKK